ncbi:MAG: hypothetical protein LC130_26225, partial [Bryobacterales bacterium]|nr:hypothetical protein [Bryobacterales bacterium]
YGGVGVRQKFTGKERDGETGLDYFGARYFSGAQGRFTSPDPFSILREAGSREELDGYLAEPQRWNKYAYSLNNPLKYVDPDGNNPMLMQLLQRLSPYADKAAAAAQRWGGQASQAASRYGQQAYVWATRFFNSPTGQEVTQTAIETAVGYQGPSPTVTGNVGRLAKAEFETGVRLAQKLGQSVRVSEHVGAEFVSAAGKTFDALGTPEAYKFWNQGQFLKSIDKHLLKSNDFTVIDLAGASKAQVAAIQRHVSSLAKELQDKIMYVGN